jgi:pSer/pThr/pTyr-binding forkhead associated (FHA) protein
VRSLAVAMRSASVVVLTGSTEIYPTAPTTISTDRTWTVGRAPDCDIVVDDSRVSRRHLVVESSGPAWVIRDVSANGSWVAGQRVGPGGIVIPDAGELRLRLGDSAGAELVIVGERSGQLARDVVASTAGHPRRHRTRWLIIALVVAVALVVVDRVSAALASTAAVSQVVQQSQGLGDKPTVSFGGFPFLTQVAFGKYRDIAVGIDDITPPGGPRIKHLSAHLDGAHIPLSKAIHNNVAKIPVDHVSAIVTIGFADLNNFLKSQPGALVLSAGKDGSVQISGTVDQDGTQINVSGSAKLQAQDGALTVVPSDLQVKGTGFDDLLNGLGGLSGLFPPIPVSLPNLPFNVRITSVHADSSGLVAGAAADHVVLDTGQ